MPNRFLATVQRAVALATFVTCASLPLAAQGARGEGVGGGGTFPFFSVFFSTGGSLTSTRDLNARLDTAKFFAVSNDAISYGGGVRGRWGRMVLGGEFASVDFGEEGDPVRGKTSALRSHMYLVQAGYSSWAGRHLNFYYMLGVGAGSMSVTLSDRNGGGAPPAGVDPTFTEIVLHPNFSSIIEANYLMFEPVVGVDWLVLRSVGDRLGLTMGARLGKEYTPNRAAWKLKGAKVIGGPDVGPDGYFMRLTFGVGWR